MYSYPNLELADCSMTGSNYSFLNYVLVSKVVWYAHLLKNLPQFVVIHKVKGFSVVNEAEVDVFLAFPCFICDPTDDANLISGSSTLSKSSL